ncbi:MAG: HAD-IC family P-type ATPase [Leptolyngbyaceae cyanobacterium HOT.MB2.61]|nr:HAD-IC family P-type ATPase [Leptolyngbyaceae cyanobacterium HOT.MB2.61]
MTQDLYSTNYLQGLSEQEVIQRRAAGQGNDVTLQTSRSYRQILQENLFSFINLVFFAISAVMVLLQRYGDAVLVVVVIFSGILMNIYQEIWAKRKLDEIALLNRPTATVLREGRERTVDPRDIVLGDILVVRSGDQILVDGAVVGDGRIDVDESLLTGESDMVPKLAGDAVYSGTFCVSGSGYFEAQKVGTETVAYKLVTGARAFRQVYTPLQQEINLVIRVFLLLACFLWILVGISFLSRSLPLADLAQRAAVIAGLVPAGLLIAITLAYGTGAVRMLGENVLIQQANAVESLSNVDVLCLDKTGTLTTNQLNLQTLYPVGITEEELRAALGDFAANTTAHNRTSEALVAALPGQQRMVKAEVPFSSARQWSAIALKDSPMPGLYVLGAPETLARNAPITDAMKAQIQVGVQQGLRVLLFAYSNDVNALDDCEDHPILPPDLTPLGILQLSDQLRPQARETLEGFSKAGISVKIISGDNPQTVGALAKQAGFGAEIRLVSGPELAIMDSARFSQAAVSCNVFGRITPEQKAHLVQTLRRQGHYVAMIGDGVNDVLSLKQANLGIAMESGSKATRGVADIVLLKDSFASLPHTFLEGQRIHNGIRDALALFIVRVFSITLLIFSTAMVTDSFPLVNKHSALVSLFGVGLPTTVLPIWAKPGGAGKRRSIVRSLLHFTIPAALTLSLVALLVYLLYLVSAILDLAPGSDFTQVDYKQPRTALVTILILCQLLLIPFLKPPTKAWVGGEPLSGDWRYSLMALFLLGIYLLILAVPISRRFFELSPLSPVDCLFLFLVALEWCLILRAVWRSRFLDRFLGVNLS